MIDTKKVLTALETKRTRYQEYFEGLQSQSISVDARLAKMQEYSYAALMNLIDSFGDMPVGALPTPEWDEAKDLCFPFGIDWANHQEARAWSMGVLMGRPVAAVDGSQIFPSKDFNIPVGAIQIGWFINPHQPGIPYIKDISFQVLSPVEMAVDELTYYGSMPDLRVNQERFIGECEQLCKIMADYADAPQRAKPLCFFDGSLNITFITQLGTSGIVAPYIAAVRKLIDYSRDYKVPLVAFVDRSDSRDFVGLANTIFHAPDDTTIALTDAGLFSPILKKWGDRSPFFYSDRDDNLSREYGRELFNDVAFTYMRLTWDQIPARIEMPHWMLEEGLANDALDLVRAECVVGASGYPYAVETADALAVISHADRERFYGLFEQFTQKSGVKLTKTRKASSKGARR